jgi:hypothetical protein
VDPQCVETVDARDCDRLPPVADGVEQTGVLSDTMRAAASVDCVRCIPGCKNGISGGVVSALSGCKSGSVADGVASVLWAEQC